MTAPARLEVQRPVSEFCTVAKTTDIPDGTAKAFEVDGVMVAVFNVGGAFSAMDDCCPHQGAPLSEGYLEGDCVTCPWHAWRFNVSDGRWMDTPGSKLKVETYETRIVGDEVQVCVPD